MQSKKESIIETAVQMGVGFILSLLWQLYILRFLGYQITVTESIGVTISFLVISTIRSYSIRRLFVRYQIRSYSIRRLFVRFIEKKG